MPTRDDTVSLGVSRGSINLRRDRPQAFREIERVLRPGGRSGTPALHRTIFDEMQRRNPDREPAQSGVARGYIREEEEGMRVEIKKDAINPRAR